MRRNLAALRRVRGSMLRLIVVGMLVVACSAAPPPASTPAPTPSATEPAPSPSPADPVAALVAQLESAGLSAREGDEFYAAPLSNDGRQVCVDGESINVYVYPSAEDAAGAASMIDPRDPSNVGTAIIEWAGNPKFWLHDRLIVLYLGDDSEVTNTLVETLGEPFAFGQGRPPLGGDDDC